MTETVSNKSRPEEIQFGDSAKHLVENFCDAKAKPQDPTSQVRARDAALALKLLFKEIPSLNGKMAFMSDVKTYLQEVASRTSLNDDQTTKVNARILFRKLRDEFNNDQPDLVRNFGINASERVNHVIQ